MKYVLLLRGINVGGKNKVSMGELKELLSHVGFEKVHSYINSGNLFFETVQEREACISQIKNLLEDHYAFSIPFALISKADYLDERAELPEWWHEELARRDVLFYPHQMDKAALFDFIKTAEFHSEVVYLGKHAVFWGKYDEAEYLKSTYHKKLIKQDFYKQVTIRNGNTYEKIAEILEKEE